MRAIATLRSTVTLLMMLIGTSLFGADAETSGIADLGWGTSKEGVNAAMQAKPDITAAPNQAGQNSLLFLNGKYGGERVAAWLFAFDANRLWKASIQLVNENPEAQYEKFRALFTMKYQSEGVEVVGAGIGKVTYWLGRNLKVEMTNQGVYIGAQSLTILRDSPSLTGL